MAEPEHPSTGQRAVSPAPTPVPPEKPAKEDKKSEQQKDDAEKEVQDKIQAALKEYGGLESNIPLNHEYWNLQGQFRAIQAAKRDRVVTEESEKKNAPSSDRDRKDRA